MDRRGKPCGVCDQTFPDGAPCLLDEDERCGFWQCRRCRQWFTLEQGADDDRPGLCDACWQAKQRPVMEAPR